MVTDEQAKQPERVGELAPISSRRAVTGDQNLSRIDPLRGRDATVREPCARAVMISE